eukprot:jgi/Mesvir1/22051/Mv12706-RA.1
MCVTHLRRMAAPAKPKVRIVRYVPTVVYVDRRTYDLPRPPPPPPPRRRTSRRRRHPRRRRGRRRRQMTTTKTPTTERARVVSGGEINVASVSTMETIKDSDIHSFTLQGLRLQCKVVSCYDGDTARVVTMFPWSSQPQKLTLRLAGINAPEINPRVHYLDRDEIRYRAKISRNALIRKVTNCVLQLGDVDLSQTDLQKILDTNTKLIDVSMGRFDAFGRVLATVYADGVDVNHEMVKEGYATPFGSIA